MIQYQDLTQESVQVFLSRYGLTLQYVKENNEIPYSYWGSPEAGRLVEQVFIRADTPIHSLLHETCHYICMHPEQRKLKIIDAKGSTMEENACCYLQILLANKLLGYNREQLMQDMDAWGYSFRLGSARSWFSRDAEEVKDWLINCEIIDHNSEITWQLRQK